MGSAVILTVGVLLLLAVLPPSSGAFSDRLWRPLSERLPDPYRVWEYIPFGLAAAIPATRVDWKETPTAHQIVMDVPGLKREELNIEVEENRVLRVSGERRREEKKDGDHWHCVERSHGRFWREFRMPDNVDMESVAAKLEDGVLTVTLEKLPPEQLRGPRVVRITGDEDGTKKENLREGAGKAKKIEL